MTSPHAAQAIVTRPAGAGSGAYFSFLRAGHQIGELDGLRGIAILLVLLRHAVRPFEESGGAALPVFGWDAGAVLANGWIGVDLFFVLSGYLIARHLLRAARRDPDRNFWRPYLAKRGLRIVPAYVAVLLLAVAGAFPLYDPGSELLGLRVGYHLLFLQDYLPANIVVAFWSLGVEEKFYLCAPILVLALLRLRSTRSRAGALLLLMAFGVALRILTMIQVPDVDRYERFFAVFRSPFHMTLDPLLMGVLVAVLHEAYPVRPRTVGRACVWSGVLLLAALCLPDDMMARIGWWDKTIQPFLIALGFSAILYGVLQGAGPLRTLRSVPLFFLARISYSLYLVHMPLIPVSLAIAATIGGGVADFTVFFAAMIALSLAAALLIHYAVEKPFLLVKDRLGR